jgi:hypothetical protein
MPPPPTWTHPDLGLFTYDDDQGAWAGTAKVPGFNEFTYDDDGNGGSTGGYGLYFDVEDASATPSDAAVAVAARAIANQADLPAKVAAALWDDFSGVGPDSGMWWHGDPQQVAQMIWKPHRPPAKGDDFYRLMALNGIHIHQRVTAKPVAELTFAAAFDPEHGVGVLTDGETILGTGYALDAEPFAKPRKPGKR